MRLPKNILSDSYRPPAIYLCQTNKDRIGELTVGDFKGTFKWNAYSEVSFTIDRKLCNITSGDMTININNIIGIETINSIGCLIL